MDDFAYRDGALFCEDVPAESVARAAGTPCFVYSASTLRGHYDRFAAAFAEIDPLICFAVKSNSNLSVLRLMAERGAGMDLVSGGELHRALLAGADPATCVYAGVGKTPQEIRTALRAGVGWFNVESEAELAAIRAAAAETGCTAHCALRVNPDVDAHTHRHTTTGIRRTKFGVDLDRAAAVFAEHGNDPRCRLEGLHVHLGSPIDRTEPYVRALERILALADELEAAGHPIRMLNLGGGFAADYRTNASPPAEVYAKAIVPMLRDRTAKGLRVAMEPGRTLVGNAGVLLLRVLYTKRGGDKRFAICDGGMNVLLRPSHYDAFHFVWPAQVTAAFVPPCRDETLALDGLEPIDVVGPICETGDFIARDRALPPVRAGDLLAVFTAGAYGMTMASRYNTMPLPAEVLVDGATATLVRRRETWDDCTDLERETAPLPVAPAPVGAPA